MPANLMYLHRKRITWGTGRDCRVVAQVGRPSPSRPYEIAPDAGLGTYLEIPTFIIRSFIYVELNAILYYDTCVFAYCMKSGLSVKVLQGCYE